MLHKTTFDATLLRQQSATVDNTRRFLTNILNSGNNIEGFVTIFKTCDTMSQRNLALQVALCAYYKISFLIQQWRVKNRLS